MRIKTKLLNLIRDHSVEQQALELVTPILESGLLVIISFLVGFGLLGIVALQQPRQKWLWYGRNLEWLWFALVLTLACYWAACSPRWAAVWTKDHPSFEHHTIWSLASSMDVWLAIVAGCVLYSAEYYVCPRLAHVITSAAHWDQSVGVPLKHNFVLTLSSCTVAPIGEELIFRGSLLWARRQLIERYVANKPLQWLLTAICLLGTSVWFASVHTQYTIFNRTVVGIVGFGYGVYALWKRSAASSSIAHAVVNSLIAVIEHT
jgi:membrane protease YdiL (CAAX protease family)